MKKLGLLLLISGISLSGWCQRTGSFSDVEIIVGAGLSHGFGWVTWDPTFGYMLGVETNVYNFNENSSIKAGVVFTKQGGPKTKSGSNIYYPLSLKSAQLYDIGFSGKVTLYYINIPIQYYYKSDGGLYLEGGIQPGIMIGAKEKVDGSNSTNVKKSFKTVDIGIPAGAGYWINDRLSVGARVVFGFTNINSSDAIEEGADASDHNLFLLGVVRFNFNKEK